jgi:tRNA dimethylallyltransferase
VNALQTVGYRELFSYLNGIQLTICCRRDQKKNTRRFAKRQITWFKEIKYKWYDFETPYQTIIDYIASKINTV